MELGKKYYVYRKRYRGYTSAIPRILFRETETEYIAGYALGNEHTYSKSEYEFHTSKQYKENTFARRVKDSDRYVTEHFRLFKHHCKLYHKLTGKKHRLDK